MKIIDVRFLRYFTVWLFVVAVLVGGAMAAQFGFGLRRFGGLEYVSRAVGLGLVRGVAGGMSFAAALFAWITVTHDQDAATVRNRFKPIATTILVIFPILEVVGLILAFLSSWLIIRLMCPIPLLQYWSTAVMILQPDDVRVAVVGMGTSLLFLLPIGWFLAPRLAALSWRLSRKIFSIWLVLVALSLLLSQVIQPSRWHPSQQEVGMRLDLSL